MKLARSALVLVLVLSSSGMASAQKTVTKRPAALSPAEKLFYEAVTLQAGQKIADARDRVKEAVELAPGNRTYRGYLAELNFLAEQDRVDRHALAAPADVEGNAENLARYLTQAASTDRERARAIFRWVADRIAYDAEGLAAGRIGDTRAAAVLKSRKTVCEGYANLYEQLGKYAGLDVVKVVGFAKGTGFNPEESFRKRALSHAWNAVKIDDRWRLLDVTWSAGTVDGRTFVKKFNDFYFLPPAREMGFSHFPKNPEWQLVNSQEVTDEEFQQWPKIDYRLFQVGVSGSEVRKELEVGRGRKLVDAFTFAGTHVLLLDAPLERNLRAGTQYHLRLKARGFTDLVVINGKAKWQQLARKEDVYEITFTARPGDLALSGKLPYGDKGAYWSILRYQVD